ncbi:hypothetical protein NKH77_39500 [Streptomyces sp. M19]
MVFPRETAVAYAFAGPGAGCRAGRWRRCRPPRTATCRGWSRP